MFIFRNHFMGQQGGLCNQQKLQYTQNQSKNIINYISLIRQNNRSAYPEMFSSLRNHSTNLQYSERLYYNNYEYYNDYENIEQAYKNDLSKVFFRCRRKTRAKLITHHMDRKPNTTDGLYRAVRPWQSQRMDVENNQSAALSGEGLTLENLLHGYIETLFENNYSKQKVSIGEKPNKYFEDELSNSDHFQLDYIYTHDPNPSETEEEQQREQSRLKAFLEDCLNHIQHEITYWRDKAENSEDIEEAKVYQARLTFQFFARRVFLRAYRIPSHSQVSEDMLIQLFRFSKAVRGYINDVVNGKLWNSLILASPNIPYISRIIHPLVFGIDNFYREYRQKKQEKQKRAGQSNLQPRIIFINLDGRQDFQNLRPIRSIGQNLFYISIYKESSFLQLQETNLQSVETTFQDLAEAHSKLLVTEAYPIQQRPTSSMSQESSQIPNNQQPARIQTYPLNSHYIRSQLMKKLSQNADPKARKFPKLDSSEDIHFLFESMLYEEIRSFNPTLILVSYNGFLDIKETHFTEIIRNLTIIADHRLTLFTNLTELFQEPTEFLYPSDQTELQQSLEQTEEDASEVELSMAAKQFYDLRMPYTFSAARSFESPEPVSPARIDMQRFYSNISIFLKISSGIYSMERRSVCTPLSKYRMAERYLYLNRLAKLDEFCHIEKHALRKWDPQSMEQLFKNYGKWELKQNRKENEAYEKLLEKVIAELIHHPDRLPKELQYRLQVLERQVRVEQQHMTGQSQNQEKDALRGYFQQAKEMLLLENLETYKTKKVFRAQEDYEDFTEGSGNLIQCYKFCSEQEEQEELEFQKYTQILFGAKIVVIVNYRTHDDRHCILYGYRPQNPNATLIKVQTANTELTELQKQMQSHRIQEGQGSNLTSSDTIYLNYSHCFVDETLYLFWPEQWSLQDEARHKLLKMEYRPKVVNMCLRVTVSPTSCDYEEIPYYKSEPLDILPRFGCSAINHNKKIFIFGGIFDNVEDFLSVGPGISIMSFEESKEKNATMFKLENVHKESTRRGALLSNPIRPQRTILKPKINYRIQKFQNRSTGGASGIIINGGYGRETTNFYNIFSHETYRYSLTEHQSLSRLELSKGRRCIKLNGPIEINRIGKFPVIVNDENIKQHEQKFSDLPKDKFIFDASRKKKTGGQQQYEVISFLDQNYRVNDFKTDHRKIYLFGFNRTVREKIYVKFWSPELYVVEGFRTQIVHLALKTEKSQGYSIANFMMPREEDIVSLCLEEDRLYLLAAAPIIQVSFHSQTPNRHILYEGSLSNMSEIIRKTEIHMHEKFQFKRQPENSLIAKTLLCIEDKVFLVGGLAKKMEDHYQREDFTLEKIKNKFKLKTRRLLSKDDSLQMPSPVAVKFLNLFLLYSIVEETSEAFSSMKDESQMESTASWKLKIESFSEDTVEERIMTADIQVYIQHPLLQTQLKRLYPNFDDPKLVRIVPYERFRLNRFTEVLEKVIIRVNKKMDFDPTLKPTLDELLLARTADESVFRQNSESVSKFFRQMLDKFQVKFQQEKVDANFEDQELIRDIKHCYSLINKMIMENLLCSEVPPEEPECRFFLEDKFSKKLKYIAIGPLNTTKLRFFKIRFKSELSLCLNQGADEGFFYHPILNYCEEMELNPKFYRPSPDSVIEDPKDEPESVKKIHVTFKS